MSYVFALHLLDIAAFTFMYCAGYSNPVAMVMVTMVMVTMVMVTIMVMVTMVMVTLHLLCTIM